MANSFSGKLKGGKYKEMLHFVPCADDKPKVGHGISEPAIFRFLLNEETLGKFDEAEVKIPKMLEILKDIDKQSEITQVEIHQNSMNKVADWNGAFHVFIVFKTCATDGDYWWSLEKNMKYIVLQRSRNKKNVKDKLKGKPRTRVKLIEKDLKGKGTIKDLFEILWAHQVIPEKYHIKKSNCQSLVTFIGQQITEIGYNYEGYFPYSPPPESGRDKKMLDLINVIRDCSDWSLLFHLIKMGNTDLVDKTVASGKYGINALYNGLTPLHFAITLKKTIMVKHLLKHPAMNADPTKRDGTGRNALHVAAADVFTMEEEIIDLLLAHEKVNVDDVDENGQTALHLAANASNVVAVQKLLEKEANPNIFDKLGSSPLHLAVKGPWVNETVTDLLLAHGKVNVDDVDENGQTALHLAASASNVGAVQKLLENGANPHIFDKLGSSPLYVAAVRGEEAEIFDLLVAHDKVNIDDVDENGQTALHVAADRSNVIAVHKLLENGANPHIFDKLGSSPLYVAVEQKDGDAIIDLLLAHPKVKVDDVNKNGQTALHAAVSASNVMAVEHLINNGANPNIVDKNGASPLHVAATQSDGIPIIDLLLEAQIVKGLGDVNDQNKKGRTALHYAAAYSNEIMTEHLIKKGADLNRRADDGLTPLHVATIGAKEMNIIDLLLQNINEGDIQHQYRNDERLFFFARHNLYGLGDTILGRLVEKGVKPPCTETDDCTGESGLNTNRFVDKGADPSIDLTGFDGIDFLIARVKKSQEIDEILKEEEFDINGRNQDGENPLLVAILGNNVNAVNRLLERGADPTIRDEEGYTMIQVAVMYDTDCNILNLLLESGKVDINEIDTIFGMTALHWAVTKSNTATAEFLLSKGANPNVTDKHGKTPLHEAAEYARNMDIVELLVNHKDVDVNCLNKWGSSVLDEAEYNEHGLSEEIANLLKEKGAVKFEKRLFKGSNESLEKLLNYTSSNAKDEIENVLSDATVPIEDQIARINEEHLISAIRDSNVESVRRLLKNGTDIGSARGEDGENALHMASRYAKTTELIDVVLEAGKFDINGVDNDGSTPLHYAIAGLYSKRNVAHLIQLGADHNIADKEGSTSLHLAAQNEETTELIDIFLETGKFDINGVDNDGRTPLHYAIEGYLRYFPVTINARRLIQLGADPGIADKNGVTPLHVAAIYAKSMDLIEILLNTGAVDVNCVDIKGRTPLAWARDNKRELGRLGQRIITRLKEYGAKE